MQSKLAFQENTMLAEWKKKSTEKWKVSILQVEPSNLSAYLDGPMRNSLCTWTAIGSSQVTQDVATTLPDP